MQILYFLVNTDLEKKVGTSLTTTGYHSKKFVVTNLSCHHHGELLMKIMPWSNCQAYLGSNFLKLVACELYCIHCSYIQCNAK